MVYFVLFIDTTGRYPPAKLSFCILTFLLPCLVLLICLALSYDREKLLIVFVGLLFFMMEPVFVLPIILGILLVWRRVSLFNTEFVSRF